MSSLNNENFWAEVCQAGGFKTGEMILFAARANAGKSMLDSEGIEVTENTERVRDYNGIQNELNFTAGDITSK